MGHVCAICCLLLAGTAPSSGDATLRALIFSGRNNHEWQQTTPAIRVILENTGLFVVEVTETPERVTAESLSGVDVIISNWNSWGCEAEAENWSEQARAALLDFVRGGKGFVSVHAGSSSFYSWPEYQELVIASWKLDETGHGRQHEFPVTPVVKDHPITRGIERFTILDELWHRVPIQPGTQVLATAFSAQETGGTDKDEPILMTRPFGKGRSVNLLLGHNTRAMENPNFAALLSRCAQWAATGQIVESKKTPSAEGDR